MVKLLFGCGYLGRRVAAAWQAAGDEVHVVTRSAERAAEFRLRGWTAHVADICRPDTLADLPEVDTVLFCVGYDRQSGLSQREVMVDGLAHVLDHYRSRCQRFLYTSSTSVYGQDTGDWVDETSSCAPTQPGGVCCLTAERLVWQSFAPPFQGGVGGVDEPWTSHVLRHPPDPPLGKGGREGATVLRLSGIYGPGRLLARIELLQRGEAFGRPHAWLNLIYVDDAVAAILAVERHWSPNETYLVCDDEPVIRTAFYERLARLVGAPPPQFTGGSADGLNKRCSNRKLRERLGVELRYPTMNEGLPAAIAAQDDASSTF